MADLNALKSQLKEQNQRLLQVTQEKARLEAKNKINQMKVSTFLICLFQKKNVCLFKKPTIGPMTSEPEVATPYSQASPLE